MVNRLAGKVALLTGAAGSQGAAEARLFAGEGARLLLCDVRAEPAEDLAAELRSRGAEAYGRELDVTREEAWSQAVAEAEERFGRLDILVNNAAILAREGVEATDLDTWNRVVAVNQTGVWLGMKTCIPALRRAGGGSIVNISSVDGIVGKGGATAYQATKGAVRILSKSAAIEYAKERIRVNSVHPGLMASRMVTVLGPALDAEQRKRLETTLVAGTPLGRTGEPEDIAYGVLYLASDESSFVTGAELVIDGGYTAQ